MGLLLLVALLVAHSPIAFAQTTTLLSHTFDAVTAPDLPSGVVAENTSWKTSISSASPGSGLNNLSHTGSAPAYIRMGPIDLSGRTEATLSYYARRTSSYPADSLIIRFSVDGGITFPHVFSSGGLPSVASTYEFVSMPLTAPLFGQSNVYVQFDGRGGSSGSANMRIDDVLITSPLNLGAIDASFGFTADSSVWNPDSGSHFLSIDLSWPGPDSIQGFQFDLTFDASLVAFSGVTASPTALSGADWEISQTNGRIVAFSISGETLPPGENASILTTEWAYIGSPLARDTTITLGISGLVVAEASPAGDAISLPNGRRSHVLRIIANTASISVAADSLDFGLVSVGDSTSLSVEISNPTGSAALVIDSVQSSSHLFRLNSSIGPISSGQSALATFWFTPTLTAYGVVNGSAWIYHNAASDSTLISFTGIGVGGRGDADGDGTLDVADVVSALDVVSGLVSIGPAEIARYDLYPFPSGDGLVDVRDLTVQIQAILCASWPDNSALPVGPAPAPGAGKATNDAVFVSTLGGKLFLDTEVALRGVQIELLTSREPVSMIASKSGVRSNVHFDGASSAFRTVLVLDRSSSLQPGRHLLLDHLSNDTEVKLALVVTIDKQKLVAQLLDGIHTAAEAPENPLISPFAIYPNPFSLTSNAEITILSPAGAQNGRLEVVDLLGRVVFSTQTDTNGKTVILRDQLPSAPGLMFFRLETGSKVETMPLMMVR